MSRKIVNINGEILSAEKATISVFDRGFLFGDSVYEVTRTFDTIPLLLDEHLDRLWKSASLIDMPICYQRNDILAEIKKTQQILQLPDAYIRIIITRGEGEIGLDPALALRNNLIIIMKEQKPNPTWWYKKGVHFLIAGVMRNPKQAVDPNIKSGNYLNNVMAYMQAKKQGAFDAIMLNQDGLVTEGTTSNIWMVSKHGEVLTPPLKAGILEGITRKTLLQLGIENKISMKEENFSADHLRGAEEAFFTSTTKEVVPITMIDGKNVGNGKPGKMTLKLLKLIRQFNQNYVRERKELEETSR